jgi:hypothetical protein
MSEPEESEVVAGIRARLERRDAQHVVDRAIREERVSAAARPVLLAMAETIGGNALRLTVATLARPITRTTQPKSDVYAARLLAALRMRPDGSFY